MSTEFNFPANPTLNQQVTLPNGSIAQWNGTEWVSVNDSNITYPLPINQGGTGATTPSQARFNLGLNTATGEFVVQKDGTVAAPGIAFASEPGLGWFRPAAGQIATAAAGGLVSLLDSSTAGSTNLYIWSRAAGGVSLYLLPVPNGTAMFPRGSLTMSAGGLQLSAEPVGGAPNPPLYINTPDRILARSQNLTVQGIGGVGTAQIILNKSASGQGNNIFGRTGSTERWVVVLGDTSAESGGDAGSAFQILRYTDSGTYAGTVFEASRTGNITLGGNTINTGTFQANGLTTFNAVNVNGILNTGTNTNVGGNLRTNGTLSVGLNAIFDAAAYVNGAYLEVFQPSGSAGQYSVFKLRNGINESKMIRMAPGGGGTLEFVNAANTAIITSMSDGGVWNALGSFNPASDERIKHDIVPIELDADAFMRIVPISFKRNNDPESGDHWGFSAQNLYDTFPAAVVGSVTATKADGEPEPAALDTTAIQAQTVLMVQDLINRVRALEQA